MRRVVILVVFITGLSIASASPQEELAVRRLQAAVDAAVGKHAGSDWQQNSEWVNVVERGRHLQAQHTAASGSAEQAPNAGKKRRHAADSQDGTHLPGSTGASEADKVEL